jgi:hypothetical protein
MIKDKLALHTTYNEKIEYLGGVVEGMFEALIGLRTVYIDLAKKVHGRFTIICADCKKVHEQDKDVRYCEQCGSAKLAYGFGEMAPVPAAEKEKTVEVPKS